MVARKLRETAVIHKNWQELIKPKKVEFKSGGTNKVTLVAEPLERGFGLTLGNALRRVSAVVAARCRRHRSADRRRSA
jgi:hypothetical protein